jgi:UDP-N-acetylmuramoyl-tripeptide--D-alanyl-D-alanine ligase
MKRFAKRTLVSVLGWQVRRLRAKNTFKIVAVAGSVGKTSTKLAIAKVLQQTQKVRYQDGNYNDPVSVPLIFFGQTMPNIFNPLAWAVILIKNEAAILRKYPFDVVVVELGTDAPGAMEIFKKYLRADIGVLTAIAPEHMEYFADLDAVAKEELEIAGYSQQLIVNKDMCAAKYVAELSTPSLSYALAAGADYQMVNIRFKTEGTDFEIVKRTATFLSAKHEIIAEPQLYSVLAAAAVAAEMGALPADIIKAIERIKPVPGRMQKLAGINGSIILDDTYNASPQAMNAALDTVYRIGAPQKIAVLGNMNELGKYSKDEHKKVGYHCNPKELDLVVTIGPDANKYLAPAAKSKGCMVKTFDSPYDAGNYLKNIIKENALVLIKGSQNRVFAEETVKLLLASHGDENKLVRQSEHWIKIKQKQFGEA